MKKKIWIALIGCCLLQGQTKDNVFVDRIFKSALTDSGCYEWLRYLSNRIGSRLSGSVGLDLSIKYTESVLKNIPGTTVFLQPVMISKWIRGTPEYAYVETGHEKITPVSICALGGSIATPAEGIKANIVEVKSFEDLERLGRDHIEGKIVFYNKAMPIEFIDPLDAYSQVVDQRVFGAERAKSYGAVGIIVRSETLKFDNVLHTGSVSYGKLKPEDYIPAATISTEGAELVSSLLKLNPATKFHFKQFCKTLPDVQSYNVVAEIKGSKYPHEILLVNANLDSWDLGDGSQDSGSGCTQAMEVINIFNKLNYKPKKTLRIVLFTGEELGNRGSAEYSKVIVRKSEKHSLILKSDSGGFYPRGFAFDCSDKTFEKLQLWETSLKHYMVDIFKKDFSPKELAALKDDSYQTVLAHMVIDSQRYFDYHHSESDKFQAINKRELEIGAAAMASLVYLFDNYDHN